MNTRASGQHFERVACAHLQTAGLKLLERNANSRHGEIDLVMVDAETIVFVEVRYRRSDRSGDGLDSVGPSKRTKLIRAASLWLAAHPEHARRASRFDVVALSGGKERPEIEWLKSAFDAF
ncbi:MAG: YraN family protein [Dokdonella sp.]